MSCQTIMLSCQLWQMSCMHLKQFFSYSSKVSLKWGGVEMKNPDSDNRSCWIRILFYYNGHAL